MLASAIWLLRDDLLNLNAQTHYALIAFAYSPLAGGLINGQDHILFFLLWVGVYRCIKTGRYFDSGIFAGLSLIRFQFTVPILFFFLLRRQWRFLAGAVTSGVLIAAVSRLLVGPNLVPNYLDAVKFLAKRHDVATITSMPTLRGFLGYFHLHHAVPISIAVGLATLLWGLWAARRLSDFTMFLSFAILISMLVDYHAFLYELPVVILAFLPLLQQSPITVIVPWAVFGLSVIKNFSGMNTFGLIAPIFFILAIWVWIIGRNALLGRHSVKDQERSLRGKENEDYG